MARHLIPGSSQRVLPFLVSRALVDLERKTSVAGEIPLGIIFGKALVRTSGFLTGGRLILRTLMTVLMAILVTILPIVLPIILKTTMRRTFRTLDVVFSFDLLQCAEGPFRLFRPLLQRLGRPVLADGDR
jgi:hypothetical protein